MLGMLNFQLLNEIYLAIRELPKNANSIELSTKAKRQLDALTLLDELFAGASINQNWVNHFYSFCGKKQTIGASLAEETPTDDLLLDELLSACEEDVLDALLMKYREQTELGSKIKQHCSRRHVENSALQKQIMKGLPEQSHGFYKMLEELILKKYTRVSEYYNEILFSRKLFSKIKNEAYTLSRENALWLISGLQPDYWQFVRLFNAAGYSLREGNRRDTIIKFVIKNGNYTLETLNEMLYFFNEECIGVN